MKNGTILRLILSTGLIAAAGIAPVAMVSAASNPAATAASASAAEPVDKAQIAAARPMVDKLFPVGIYRSMMGENMSRMMDGMMDGLLKMPIDDLARIGGVSEDRLAQMNPASLEEVTAIVDPYYRERAKRGIDAMMGGMTDLMDSFEPHVREALVRAYARKFSAAELADLNAFFSTPTGGKYAGQSMSIFMDPEIMGEMQALMPEMMRQMPEMAQNAKKAADALPPPRKFSDLSKAERKRLAALLGVKEKDLADRSEKIGFVEENSEEGTEQ